MIRWLFLLHLSVRLSGDRRPMLKPISAAEFHNTMPDYVSQVYQLTDTIIQRGFDAPPNTDTQVSARRAMRIGWETDSAKLRELWDRRDDRDERLCFEADIGLEGTRLAIERTRWNRAAWLYAPSAPAGNLTAVGSKESAPTGQASSINWINGPERRHPRNLTSPVWDFSKQPDNDPPYEIKVGLYEAVYEDSSTTFGRRNINEITADSYRQARYPRLLRADVSYLTQGVYTLHTHKIKTLLHVLSLVARWG